MKFHRTERVSKLIREELAKVILRECEFPGVLVTLTDVEVDKKMEHAKVGVSVLPESAEPGVMGELERRAGWLQHLVFVKINIRPMPLIAFRVDHGYENAAEVEKALLKE